MQEIRYEARKSNTEVSDSLAFSSVRPNVKEIAFTFTSGHIYRGEICTDSRASVFSANNKQEGRLKMLYNTGADVQFFLSDLFIALIH